LVLYIIVPQRQISVRSEAFGVDLGSGQAGTVQKREEETSGTFSQKLPQSMYILVFRVFVVVSTIFFRWMVYSFSE
jgi:hypothetical protein